MWGEGDGWGGRPFSSVIQILILNVIGSRNYIFRKPTSLCIALRAPQVLNCTLTLENRMEMRLTGRTDSSASLGGSIPVRKGAAGENALCSRRHPTLCPTVASHYLVLFLVLCSCLGMG